MLIFIHLQIYILPKDVIIMIDCVYTTYLKNTAHIYIEHMPDVAAMKARA